jgi:hypothetical protein
MLAGSKPAEVNRGNADTGLGIHPDSHKLATVSSLQLSKTWKRKALVSSLSGMGDVTQTPGHWLNSFASKSAFFCLSFNRAIFSSSAAGL